ncbi:MAG: TRAP transporter small permease [Bacteriovoracaceae bacterium]|nr:TRAP transporter small permease [Bacteriovoracaceae bacterium]
MKGILKAIDEIIEKLSSYVLIFSVFSMLLISVLSIILRWFSISIHWTEPFVRHLVFLATFLGGVLATGRGTHIGIDIVGKYLESKNLEHYSLWITRIIALASFLTLVWLTVSAKAFMDVELKYGKPVFWGISSGFLVGIIPFGFSIIAYRFFYIFVDSFSANFRSRGEA